MLPRHALEMGCFPAISINGAAHRTNWPLLPLAQRCLGDISTHQTAIEPGDESRISSLDADVVRSEVERWLLLPRSDVYSRP
jgi:hypothetical protein